MESLTARSFLRIARIAAFSLLFFSTPGLAREQIRIVGSSTVYPFAASVAEHFGKAGDFRTPVVEATGTGAGFKLFCQAKGVDAPDVTNASRGMLPEERAQCLKAGITDIVEVKIGFDGITLANSLSSPVFKLTKKQIFLALAREVPRGGVLVPNYHQRWNQVDPELPDLPIKVYGTPPVSGTRDTFDELVMQKGCSEVPEFGAAYRDAGEYRKHCQMIREDGAFIEAGENGNLVVQRLIGDPEALGIFGFSFLDQNSGKLHASLIDGISPGFESIQSGIYGISRPLYFYFAASEPAQVKGLKEYTEEFMSEGAIGDEGYLALEGLVPLPEAERARQRQAIMAKLGR